MWVWKPLEDEAQQVEHRNERKPNEDEPQGNEGLMRVVWVVEGFDWISVEENEFEETPIDEEQIVIGEGRHQVSERTHSLESIQCQSLSGEVLNMDVDQKNAAVLSDVKVHCV